MCVLVCIADDAAAPALPVAPTAVEVAAAAADVAVATPTPTPASTHDDKKKSVAVVEHVKPAVESEHSDAAVDAKSAAKSDDVISAKTSVAAADDDSDDDESTASNDDTVALQRRMTEVERTRQVHIVLLCFFCE